MFARLSRAVVEGVGCVLRKVVHPHAAVVEADTQQVGVVLVDVETHHPTLCRVQVLGV